jgi:catechol 2,3-dioxygenase-like lactoylglutathione lyase family enzyme
MSEYDRAVEDVGNVVFLEHVNTRVPDQQLATAFYVAGLGLTRDPYLMTGITNMWVNVGRSQFHLPSGQPQVLRGHTGLVIPGRADLLQRLAAVTPMLEGTEFGYSEAADHVEAICPWGNRIRCFEPGARFGQMRLGMPYVELNVPLETAQGIVRFYNTILETPARLVEENGTAVAIASVGAGQDLRFRETSEAQPEFDGHHIAIYLADFSGPYKRMIERGLITEESDQHQYRFLDLVDPDDGRVLFRLEHEVRSMRHPLYAREHVNRNPAQSNRIYSPGHEDAAWSLPATG